MRNLKRVLSLVMASVMLLGMMVVGASAASFPDSDKVEHTEAVDTMVALGIILGTENGTFDPERIVTRAEMAKMICVALNKGKDPNLSGGGTYPDTVGHWASGYIDYCSNLGIVAGDNNGNFNPNATVTAVEAAKMILIAIGYNAENEGYVNDAKWDTNIGVDASTKGLYEDVAVVPSAGLTRDNAAQMIYNGIQADMVEYDYKVGAVDGNVTSIAIAKDISPATTILADKFNLLTQEGYLSRISYNSTNEKYTYTVLNDGVAIETVPSGNFVAVADKADHTELFGDYVKMLYRTTSDGHVLYGMFSNSDSVVEAVKGDISVTGTNDYFKVDDVQYDVATGSYNALPVYTGKDLSVATNKTNMGATTISNASTVKFVDVDGDGEYDYAVATPSTVGKVSFVGNSSVTIGTASYDLDDDIASIYDGIAKDDYAVVTQNAFTGLYDVTVAETVTGKITAVRNTNDVRVDGTWYKKAGTTALAAGNIGSTYKLAVVGGYYYDASITNEGGSTANVLYISAADSATPTLGVYTVKAKAHFTDGTSETITINKVNDKTLSTGATVDLDNALPQYTTNNTGNYTDTTIVDASISKSVVVGAMYRYAKSSDGNYTLYPLTSTNDVTKAGYKTYSGQIDATAGFDASEDKFVVNNANYTISDDAVFFVQTTNSGNEDVKVVSGKTIKTWDSGTDVMGAAQVLANTISGFNTVRVGALVSKDLAAISGTATSNYGYITATPYITDNADGDKAVALTVWTADGEKTIEVTSTGTSATAVTTSTTLNSSTGLVKGGFIAYELDNDGYAVKARPVGTKYAVTALSGDNLELDSSIAAEVDDDTVYIYINSADTEGADGGELQMAIETAIAGTYVKNVVAEDGTIGSGVAANSTLAVVFIDIANNLDNSSTKTITDNTLTAVDVQIDQANRIIYLNGKTVVAASGFAIADTANKLVVTGAAYTVNAASTDLAAGDSILVVAENGTTATYTVADGVMPS